MQLLGVKTPTNVSF